MTAETQWLGSFPFGNNPGVDLIFTPHDETLRDRKFVVAAKRLPGGTTLDDWTASHVATLESEADIASQPICSKARAFRNTTLGGEPAREFQQACSPEYDVIVLTTVHRGRGYIFQFVSPKHNTAASDRRTYDAGRRAFGFTPK